jgi:hypothetical protein
MGWDQYLFSGFMICGLCGARMIIVSGDGKRAYVSGDVNLFNVLGDLEEVCSSNGGQRRLWSVLHTPFRFPTTGIVLNPRLDVAAGSCVAY